MTPADLAALERGCCTRAGAAEKGCTLCVPRFAAIDRLVEELQREKQRADEAELAVETWVTTEAEIHREGAERDRAEIAALERQRDSAREKAEQLLAIAERAQAQTTHVLELAGRLKEEVERLRKTHACSVCSVHEAAICERCCDQCT